MISPSLVPGDSINADVTKPDEKSVTREGKTEGGAEWHSILAGFGSKAMNDEPMPRAWLQHFDERISYEAMKQRNDVIRHGRDDECAEVKPVTTKQGHSKTLMVKTTIFRDERKQPLRLVGSVIDLLWFKLLEK